MTQGKITFLLFVVCSFSFCCLNLQSWWTALKQFIFSLPCSSDIGQSNLACCSYSISWLKYIKGHKSLIRYVPLQMKRQNCTPKSKPDFSFILHSQDKENVSLISLWIVYSSFLAVQFFLYIFSCSFPPSALHCQFHVRLFNTRLWMLYWRSSLIVFETVQWAGHASVAIKWMFSLGLNDSKANKWREQ